jgi:hypothetical protein
MTIPLWIFLLAALGVILLVVGFSLIIVSFIPDNLELPFPYPRWSERVRPRGESAVDMIMEARANCDCPCHQRKHDMMPGMRCIDCINELCDEGTQ